MLARGLTTACNKIQPTLRNELSTSLLTKLLEGMQKRFGGLENNILLARATFFDPRFKKNGFMSGSSYNNVKDSVTAAISRQLAASSADATSSAVPEESRSETSVLDVDDLIWGDFDRSAAVQVRNPQASTISLVRQFVDEPNIGRRDDPLAWWWGRVQVYRELVPLARKSV